MKQISGQAVCFRQMTAGDFAAVFALWKKAELDLAEKQVEWSDFQKIVKMNPALCFVITEDDVLIGAVLGTFNGRRGWIYHLAVHPAYQHQGYGSLLLGVVEKELKKMGAYKVNLAVTITNLKVLSFYHKNGYQFITDALYLKKDL